MQIQRGLEPFSWDLARQQLESALLIASLVQSTWMIETFPGHESTWQARRFVLHALQSRPATRTSLFEPSPTVAVLADIDLIAQIDEVVGLLGELLITNTHCHAWSGRTPLSDDEAADDSDREDLLRSSSGTDIFSEVLRGAVQLSGLLDLQLPGVHSLQSERAWAQEQASRHEDVPRLVSQHLFWLERNLTP